MAVPPAGGGLHIMGCVKPSSIMFHAALLCTVMLPACCPLTGNAAAWSFATKRPADAALVGKYRADWTIRFVNTEAWKRGTVDLRADGTVSLADFPIIPDGYGLLSTPQEPATLSGEGRWSIEENEVGDATYYTVVLTVDGTTSTVRVWHNSPPHKLWIQVGDWDAGDGVLFRPVRP